MADRHGSFLRKNWMLLAVLVAAIGLALWFASRLMLDALYFNDPRNVDVDLKPWMTPRFVMMTYDLPRDVVMDILEIDPAQDRGVRLGHLAEDRGMTMQELTDDVRAAASEYREGQP